jgi:amino acid transporter
MPYRQYVLYFRPTTTCGSCGQRVRFRRFASVVSVAVLTAAAFLVFTRLVDSPALEVTVGAILILGGLIVDLWTYRNVEWDLVRERASEIPHPEGLSVGG